MEVSDNVELKATSQLNAQLAEIERIAARLDRDHHSTDIIKEVQDLNDYAMKLRERLNKSPGGADQEKPFVTINSSVLVYDENEGEQIEYHIVNSDVFELEGNDVTFTSPIGRALLFKEAGDKVSFKIPVGIITYLVKEVEPDEDLRISYDIP